MIINIHTLHTHTHTHHTTILESLMLTSVFVFTATKLYCFEWDSATKRFSNRAGFPIQLTGLSPPVSSGNYALLSACEQVWFDLSVIVNVSMYDPSCVCVKTAVFCLVFSLTLIACIVCLHAHRRGDSRVGCGRCGPWRTDWSVCQHHRP